MVVSPIIIPLRVCHIFALWWWCVCIWRVFLDGCVAPGSAACGLRWKDQRKREAREAALAAESALDTNVAVAAAAVQQQLDETSAAAAAAAALYAPERGAGKPWQCQHCASRDMFCHRPGPGGMGTLCNGMVCWRVRGRVVVEGLGSGRLSLLFDGMAARV